jgi:nitrogen regulatory protein PII
VLLTISGSADPDFTARPESAMKRIELVIEPQRFEDFSEIAKRLRVSEFEITEVHYATRSNAPERRRLYRGCEFVIDLVERLKIEFTVPDELAAQVTPLFIESVRPVSVAVIRLDDVREIGMTAVAGTPRIHETAALAAAH